MSCKLILLDLDGTLLTSEKTISPANYQALRRLAAQGVHIVPSTGRFYSGMPQVVRELDFVRYAITVNGAQVYDAREDKILAREDIQLPDAFQVFDALDALPVIYDCFLDGWGYMTQALYDQIDNYIADPRTNHMVKTLRQPVPELRQYLLEQGRPLQKIQMFFRDMGARESALESLPKSFPHMAVSSSIPNNIEINAKNANKGHALRFLCRYLGVDIAESMAFGDGSNDLSMIQAAGIGVAMANGEDALLAQADYVTDTNDNDGVAKALRHFEII